jgi:hypothetical protein
VLAAGLGLAWSHRSGGQVRVDLVMVTLPTTLVPS